MFEVLDLPFDQYQRYGLVKALLESVRAPGERFQVLDVGGRTGLLRKFLPNDGVELVDVVASDIEGLVLGSGASLPFKDNSFDVVAAFDTLEHVPPDMRGAFVSECGRVAKRYVMLAGPYDSPRVAEAEQHLLDFLKVRLNWEHRYLAEHRENGLPDAVQTRSILRAAPGARVESFGHGSLDRWLLLMMLELYIEHEGLLHGLGPRIYRFYNEHLFRSDHGPEVYRHALVAAFNGAPMPSLESALDPPGSAPREATEIMTQMGAELLRYDALRDTYLPEMERMHGEVAAATKNVAEHRASMQTFADDLEQHRMTIEALRAELSKERAGAEAVMKDRDLQINGYKAKLAEQEGLVASLTSMREAEMKELEARGAALHEANGALTQQNEVMVQQNEVMVQQNEAIAQTHEALAEQNRALVQKDERIVELERLAALLGSDIQGLIGHRDQAVAERDKAQRLFVGERERAEALAKNARSLSSRVARRLTLQKIDEELLKEQRPIPFDA